MGTGTTTGGRSVARASAESHELGWFTPADLARIDADASVRRLFRIVFG